MSEDARTAQRPAERGKAARDRERLDTLLVEGGLAPSRERARALIMAGAGRVNGAAVTNAGTLVPRTASCEIAAAAAELRYASRGGLKLERALDVFGLDPSGRVCLDVGASTGGFTDVLLRRGAARVYAVDVGHGQLAWTLRNDPRVVVMDRTNIRHLAALPELVDCAVVDVSFISYAVFCLKKNTAAAGVAAAHVAVAAKHGSAPATKPLSYPQLHAIHANRFAASHYRSLI